MDITSWLRNLGLERYEQAFSENAIDVEILPKLTIDDLKDIGVVAVGHRRKLLEAIAALEHTSSVDHERLLDSHDGLEKAEAVPIERRHLTIMFVDLVGSTELSTRLDPEDTSAIMRAYQNVVAGEITRFEGHIAKYLGDGVLAFFGYPKAHEDEAERAVRAALALIQAVGKVTTPADEPLAARVGIATGLVVVGEMIGEGDAEEQTVAGETPNLAARLQALAEPGGIVISQSTQHLVEGLFEFDDLGTHHLKGFAEPIRACTIMGERPIATRFEARSASALLPMVGRDQELALILDRWNLAKEGEGQGVLLVGEAGIGKSRITRAFLDLLVDETHTSIRYQCSPYHTESALWPVVQQLTHAAGLTASDTIEAKLDKLEALLDRAGGHDAAPLIADLIGLDGAARYGDLNLTSEVLRAQTLDALVEQLLGLAANQPVLLLLEDAHWIDPSMLRLVEQSMDRIVDARVLLLLTSRPDSRPELLNHPHLTQLSLNRLSRAGIEAIATRLAGKALSAEIVDGIVDRADGVPLFVEELTKAVLETNETAIPASLNDSLMARLDRNPEVKLIAQMAACIGREFDYQLLVAIAEQSEQALLAALDQLASAELLFRRGTPPDASFAFKHALVRDTAYTSLLRRRREEIHGRVARALERGVNSSVPATPELLARHFTEGGVAEKAIPYWLEAGEKSARRSANAEAIEAFNNGLELVLKQPGGAQRDEMELAFQLALGPVLMAARGLVGVGVEHAYRRAKDLCDTAGDQDKLWPVLFGLSRFHLMRGEVEKAKEIAHELSSLASADEQLSIPASWAQGAALFWGGAPDLAQPCFKQVTERYESERDHALVSRCAADPGVVCNAFLAWILWMRGFPDQALDVANQSTSLAQALSHHHSAVWAQCFSAKLHLYCRNLPVALSQSVAVIELSDELGFPHQTDYAKAIRGRVLVERGDATVGMELIARALDGMLGRGQRVMQHWCLEGLAQASHALGDSSKALDLTSEALAVIDQTDARWWESELHRLKGELLASSDCDAAQASLDEAIEVARRQHAKSLELRAATSLARFLKKQGKRREANDLLSPIYDWFTEGFDTLDLIDAKVLLDDLN